MIVPRLIERKRDGLRLEEDQWHELIAAYADGRVPDYQMSALMMAIHFRGLDAPEMAALTDAMLKSGSTLDLGHLGRPRIDKHSTGGVGDKVSLLIAPLAASLGIAVPMMSGRGLGHTGGTLDKLESIPGFRTALSLAETTRQIESIGCALIGQTDEIAPADKKMYALRDTSATVEVVPLIAASIMSKKLAESLTGLVVDVKRGSGSFITNEKSEIALARAMIELGANHGCPVVALFTAMDRPLGFACGNSVEVVEAIRALKGDGPEDLMTVTYALGAEMLLLAGLASTAADAWRMMRVAIESGSALEKLGQIIEAQGGNPRVTDDLGLLPRAAFERQFLAGRSGYILRVAPRIVGHGIIALGGGRRTIEDSIDPSVGFVITAKPGMLVEKGEPLAMIHARDEQGLAIGERVLREAIIIGDGAEASLELVSYRVTATSRERWKAPAPNGQ
ncbi:MAG: thymidine phosphorylase [Gemmatimonadaceae bacterium]|nr:thymidine phosphorylase [Gemmatimonadaceae bacterium]